jgi:hypothetical protein
MMVWMLYEQERKGVVVEKKKRKMKVTQGKIGLSLAEQEQKEYALPISTHEDGTVKCSSSFKIKK